MAKITYDNKSNISTSTAPVQNKVTDDDMNEIKSVVNSNYDILENLFTYSTTEEKVVGTWINGKPIYRLSFIKLSPQNNWQEFNHNIANVDDVVKIEGEMIGSTHQSVSFNFAGVAALYGSGVNLLVRADRTKVQYGGGASDWTATLYIHLYYTKTTD